MRARGLRDHLPGHRRRPVRRRQLGQPDDVQQRPGGGRGGERGQATAPRRSPQRHSRRRSSDLELVDGHAQVVGSPDRRVSIAELASHGPRRVPCCSAVARASRRRTRSTTRSACVGRLGLRVVLGADVLHPCGAGPRRPATGVVRVLKVVAATDVGRVLNPVGAQRPDDRRDRDGLGQRADRGHACTAATGSSATRRSSTTSC